MKRRKNPTQPVRDAAVLLALILLLLTVRPIEIEAVADLIPDAEAADAGLARPDDDAVADPVAEIDTILADLPGVEIITLGDVSELQMKGKMICRVTTTENGVDTDCSRIVAMPLAPHATRSLPAGWSDTCPEDQEKS